MLLRTVLLVVLPLLAVCQPTDKSVARDIVEKTMKPCILKRKCPPEIPDVKDETLAQIVQAIREHKTPNECKCDLTADACFRGCFFAETVNVYLIFAAAGRSGQAAIKEAQALLRETLESQRSCFMERKDCDFFDDLSPSRMKRDFGSYSAFFSLPKECNDPKVSIRPCYASIFEKNVLYEPAPAPYVAMLLMAPFAAKPGQT